MSTTIHTLTIQRYANNGFGIGFLHNKAVFIPYCAIGDVLTVEIINSTKTYSFARIVDIINPSPIRIQPRCPAFACCGGCDFLHIPYEEELSLKKNLFINTLQRIGGIPIQSVPGIEIIASQRFAYRSHATFQSNGADIGFFKKDSHVIQPLPQTGCLLVHNDINRAIVTGKKNSGAIRIAVDHYNKIGSDPNDVITEIEQGIVYKRNPQLFFQANRFLRGKMLSIVNELTNNATHFLDVGCGVGFFSLYMSKRMEGTGIDLNTLSITFAKMNSTINTIPCNFYATTIENYHPYTNCADCVIIDPPRQGISRKGRKTIIAMDPATIVYISCNPVTFARDVRSFIDSNYRLQKLFMIDMFPCTHHTEVIGLMKKS